MADGLAVGDARIDQLEASIGYPDKISFSGGGESTYAGFARQYGWIALLFGIAALSVFASRFQKQAQVAMAELATALLSSLFILYQLRQLIRDKAILEPYFWESPRNHFALQTITYDWLLVGLTCVSVVSIASLSIGSIRKVFAKRKGV